MRERDFNHLNEWLLPQIQQMGLSIERFARLCGVSRSAIYYFLNDNIRPTEEVMASICRVLGRPLEEGLAQYTPKRNGRPPGSGSGHPKQVTVRGRKFTN